MRRESSFDINEEYADQALSYIENLEDTEEAFQFLTLYIKAIRKDGVLRDDFSPKSIVSYIKDVDKRFKNYELIED
ncbi:MAG: hypothetical protein ACM3SR_10665 [Ignavibacteriales bacterium]